MYPTWLVSQVVVLDIAQAPNDGVSPVAYSFNPCKPVSDFTDDVILRTDPTAYVHPRLRRITPNGLSLPALNGYFGSS